MKKIIIAILLIASTVSAADMCQTPNGSPINGFCPNGLYSALLTVNSKNYDMSDFVRFSVYAPAAGKIRFMNTTSATSRGNFIAEPTIAGAWNDFTVSRKTPYVHFSSMTDGYLRRH